MAELTRPWAGRPPVGARRPRLLLSTATELFQSKGYAPTTVNDIAMAADTTRVPSTPASSHAAISRVPSSVNSTRSSNAARRPAMDRPRARSSPRSKQEPASPSPAG
ncbi:helix-turn-helix domain-containing protein [Streptomyces pratensis]|uniref:helix-turn-helix domain-containing protein n=1 Tax=Streptomyces pratensis TaxID=1169025 RepID=UPI003631A4AF